ncbi:Uncharacterised protein [Mycobacteroides abscessus subsp. abscessus]|nr:Uncharacterised protein [Mycobacteroides abscessus subsp. abscessus]
MYLRQPDNEAPPRRNRLPPPSRKDSRSSRVWISADVYTPTRPMTAAIASQVRLALKSGLRSRNSDTALPLFKTISTYAVSK